MQLQLPFDDDPILPRIRARLIAVHGPQHDAERADPTTQLVKAMIGSRSLDVVSDAAFEQLRRHFPSWDMLPDAEPAAILPHLAEVTYASDKAMRLIDCARLIRDRRGRFDLAFLDSWTADHAMAFLQKLPGIGPEVAATTLNFSSLRKRVFAADTHVLRTCFRLGLVPGPRGSARELRLLAEHVPDSYDADDLYELHWLLKAHGQARCHHRLPACDACPLADLCAHRQAGAATPSELDRDGGPAMPVADEIAPTTSTVAVTEEAAMAMS
ncbi:endonuclease-3 [Rhizobiales bacterium GAS188]|nr:endonuclease-3 [Rhizobiales bacterium GAS188]